MAAASPRTVILQDESLRRLEGFTQIPNVVLKHASISYGAKVAFGVLLSYAWQEDFCFPAQERLSKDLNCSVRQVRRLLTELKDAGFITWKQQGLNLPNVYHILPQTKWTPSKSSNGKERTDLSHPDRTHPDRSDSSSPDRTDLARQDVTDPSDKEDPINKIQTNVNVTRNASPKRTPTAAAISETALTKHYGLTSDQVDKVRRLVDQQADVLGHRDRNHAAYVKRAAEAVRDGLAAILDTALGDVKDTSHRKAIASLPAYFTRVYDAMRSEATRPRLDFTQRARRGEGTHEPTSAGDVMRSQRDRLIASISAQGFTLPPHLKNASVTAIAAWYDQARQRTPRP